MKVEGERRFALLQAAEDSDYVKKVHGSYLNVFVAALGGCEGKKWDVFHVVHGDFPELSDLHIYDGFVVSGSPHDAYSNATWVLQLCLLLQTLFAMQKKLLGVCFGHQVLCRALGGKVAKSYNGWDVGVRKVNLTEDFYSYNYALSEEEEEEEEEMKIPPSLSIIECHQDEVWEVPVGAQVLGWSDKTGVEMFRFGDNVLGIQGHPEYTKDILHNLIDRLLATNLIQRGLGEEAKMQLVEEEPDRKYWEKICKGFLKGRWTQLQLQLQDNFLYSL